MKLNKWTLGLAAVGAVSLASVAQAEEKMNVLQTAMTSTTISGYVDTSMQWNPGTGDQNLPTYAFGGSGKADGFNLNVVQLTIAKPLDESEWASGYRADLWFGPDANGLNTSSTLTGGTGDLAIRQAYVALRTPVGNGIDWKIGVFDTIVGYETLESGNNPNMTRSYGFTMEPYTHTGLLGTYRFSDSISASAGIANTFGTTINDRAQNYAGQAESYKTYMGSVALTAPSDWGWVAGSSLYAGAVVGFDAAAFNNNPLNGQTSNGHRQHFYVGATIATPVAGLKAGAAVDYSHIRHTDDNDQTAYALYLSYQATEKMSLHGRAEYLNQEINNNEVIALTGTIQYDLWQNVLSRLEVRWDHSEDDQYGTNQDLKNAVMVAANFIYKF